MKNRGTVLTNFSYSSITTKQNYPTVTAFGSRPGLRDTTISSAIIRGDFRRPLPFSYEVDLIRSLNGATNDYHVAVSSGQDWVNVDFKGQIQHHSSHEIAKPSFADSWIYNACLDRLNEQVRGGLDLTTAVAEAGSTARMIKAIGSFHRLFSGIGGKRWANEWLEYSYGWKPLLSDIYGAAEESVRVVLNDIEHVQARYQSRESSLRPSNVAANTGIPVPILVSQDGADGKVLKVCRIGVTLRASPQFDWARWASVNPIGIAWELCPYSFVADWFFDVGSYLRNFETSLLYSGQFVSGYVSHLSTLNDSYVVQGGQLNHVTGTRRHDYSWGLNFSRRYARFRRSTLSSYPLPRLPTITADLGWRRLVSAGALLSQAFGRR